MDNAGSIATSCISSGERCRRDMSPRGKFWTRTFFYVFETILGCCFQHLPYLAFHCLCNCLRVGAHDVLPIFRRRFPWCFFLAFFSSTRNGTHGTSLQNALMCPKKCCEWLSSRHFSRNSLSGALCTSTSTLLRLLFHCPFSTCAVCVCRYPFFRWVRLYLSIHNTSSSSWHSNLYSHTLLRKHRGYRVLPGCGYFACMFAPSVGHSSINLFTSRCRDFYPGVPRSPRHLQLLPSKLLQQLIVLSLRLPTHRLPAMEHLLSHLVMYWFWDPLPFLYTWVSNNLSLRGESPLSSFYLSSRSDMLWCQFLKICYSAIQSSYELYFWTMHCWNNKIQETFLLAFKESHCRFL